ncbi:LPXTG cell wall anchor domain-containing protein [Enterococcus hirae]
MKSISSKVLVGLGIALFGVTLGNEKIYGEEIKEVSVVSQVRAVDAEIPDLPTNPELPTDPDIPTGDTTTDDSTDGSTEGSTPSEPSEPEIPSQPDEPTVPDEPVAPDTPITPPATDDSTNGSTEDTTPPTTDDSTGGNTEESTPSEPNKPEIPSQPTPPSQPSQPSQPSKPENGGVNQENTQKPSVTLPSQNVVVRPDGTVGSVSQSNAGAITNEGTVVPIKTNNLSELTHIPTASTPVETNSGEKIVSVVDGVPYKQTENGLAPISGEYETLPSGNVAVKGSDGKTKVLPQTGMHETLLLTAIGSLVLAGTGWYLWNEKKKEEKSSTKQK